VCKEVATCYQLVATRRPKAVLYVEFDEQFESEVRMTLASMVQEICASLEATLAGGRVVCVKRWRPVTSWLRPVDPKLF
jgi:hypothetical protein